MSRIRKGAAVAALALGVSGVVAGAACAAVLVTGGLGAACYQSARDADRTHFVPEGAVELCSRAMYEGLNQHDMAGTYVNRGVLEMLQSDLASAMNDFQKAVGILPTMAEAHVNLGAAMVGMRKDREGVDEITKGLAMGSAEPEKSYFNRAVGREHLDDVDGAYADYMKAAELKPNWQQPKQELARFQVVPKDAASQR